MSRIVSAALGIRNLSFKDAGKGMAIQDEGIMATMLEDDRCDLSVCLAIALGACCDLSLKSRMDPASHVPWTCSQQAERFAASRRGVANCFRCCSCQRDL